MADLFELPELPAPNELWEFRTRKDPFRHYNVELMQAYARTAQIDLIGRLAQMQEHEAIEWLLKARQDWWKS